MLDNRKKAITDTCFPTQAFNLAFAICGILGSKYGMGKKLLYFAAEPQNFHKALLVRLLVSHAV